MASRKTGRVVQCAICSEDYYASKRRLARGTKWCSRKCQRIAQSGSADVVEAFWLKVDKTSRPAGCWLYTGFRKWDGYGWLARYFNGKVRYLTAHRYAWMLLKGDVPAGMHVLHKCDNPPCCNPDHLWLGTHQDNMRDKSAKGRFGTLFPDRVRPKKETADETA